MFYSFLRRVSQKRLMDLAAALIQAIEEQRAELNSSRIAQGEPGRVEIHVNPIVRSVRIVLIAESKRVA